MMIPHNALTMIMTFESCLEPVECNEGEEQCYKAYADPGYGWKLPTIGWGTVAYEDGTKVKRGDLISQSRADDLLIWEVKDKMRRVVDIVKVPIDEDKLAALISFAYNVGVTALSNSTLLKKLNGQKYNEAADQFLVWNKSNGKVLRGLTRRRQSEKNLFEGKHPFIVA